MVDDFEKKLGEVITRIESKSDIQIVPVIVESAGHYFAWSMVYGLAVSYLLVTFARHVYWFLWVPSFEWLEAPVFLIIGAAFAWIIRKTPLFGFCVPKLQQRERCAEMAHALFASERVFDTDKRLGILISVFKFEKMAMVFADKGFDAALPSAFWKDLGERLARDFNQKKPGDEFLIALSEIEAKVVPLFKEAAGHLHNNQLDDHLRKK